MTSYRLHVVAQKRSVVGRTITVCFLRVARISCVYQSQCPSYLYLRSATWYCLIILKSQFELDVQIWFRPDCIRAVLCSTLPLLLSPSFPIESCDNMCIQLLHRFYNGSETAKH